MMSSPISALDAVRHHRTQIDEDGTLIGVSRQALDEVIADYYRLTRELAEAQDGWYQANGVADLAMKHRDMAESELASVRAENERLRGMLKEARDSVRHHWRKHVKGLERAIRANSPSVVLVETRREAELRGLRDRIDAALGGSGSTGGAR